MKLSDEQIAERLLALAEWGLDNKTIQRRYRFQTFMDAVAFVNRVAEIAEQRNHHPFISIDFKMVTLKLTSWHAGGLTDADFDEAAVFDEVYESGGKL